jgi:hypothetical protein
MGLILNVTIITQLAIALHPAVLQQKADPCAGFQQLIKATYGFKPSRLSESEQTAKSAAMDSFWEKAKSNSIETLPCLRAALQDPSADKWFRFDASGLLVEMDPSTESKAIQVRSLAAVDLDDVDLRVWVGVLARRGFEGLDVSAAGARWLTDPRARYFLPEHGGYEVKTFEGALFIFGSMDESQATPALLRIASQADHPGREPALRILMDQATPESLRALGKFTGVAVSTTTKNRMRQLLAGTDFLKPRSKPKTSREVFVRAFQEMLDGDSSRFMELASRVPDGEQDVVAVLKPEDLPLVRKVRRMIIAGGNQHAIEYYNSFTEILLALVWRPEFVK